MFRTRSSREKEPQPPFDEDMVVIVERSVNPFLVVFHDPSGYRAEQIRALRNKLIAMNPDGTAKTLVVVSAIKGEGKTITAINLALAFAELERTPVLLVDGDLRSPCVESYLNLNPAPGLSDILLGAANLNAAVRDVGVRNLAVMGAGSRVASPSETLTSPKVEQLFERLKERYQYVVVDTPPCMAATDAGVLAAQADGALMVVRLEYSSKNLTRESVRNLQDLGANLLGTFVTEVRGTDPESDPRLAYGPPPEL